MLLEKSPRSSLRTLYILRYAFLITSFFLVLFGYLIPVFIPEAIEYLYDRYFLSACCLFLFTLTFFTKDIDKIRRFFIPFFYLCTIVALFHMVINDYIDIYVYLFIIGVFAFNHALRSHRAVVIFLGFTLICSVIATVFINQNLLLLNFILLLLTLSYLVNRARVITFENEQNVSILLATILNETVDAIFLADKSGKIVGSNKRALEIFKAEDLDQLKQHYYKELLVSDIEKEFLYSSGMNKKVFRGNVICKTFDDKQFWGEITINKIRNDNKPYLLVKITDIDQQLKAQEELIRSEVTLKSILESSNDQIWLIDKNFKLISFNTAFKKSILKQFNVNLYAGYNLLPLLSHKNLNYKYWKRDYDRALKGETFTIEETLRDDENSIIEVIQVTYNPVFIENKVFGVSVFMKDITNLRKKELEYLKFRTAIDCTSEAIGIADIKGRSVYHNDAYNDLFGYSPEEVNEKGLSAIFKNIEQAKELMRTTINGFPWSGEITLLNKKREEIIVYLKSDALKDEEGNIIGIIGLHRDITEEKLNEERIRNSEEKYRLLSENTTDLVCLHDLEGIYTYVSPSIKEILGYNADDMVGKNPFDFIHPDDIEPLIELAQNRVKLSLKEATARYRLRRIDGTYTWVESITKVIHDKDNTAIALQSSSRDISAWKIAEEELLKAKNLAEAGAKAKSEFLAVMSHEIRTPLNAVIGMTDLLMDTPLNKNQNDIAETIKISGENLLFVINDILDYSKIEAGSLDIESEIVNIKVLIEEIIDMLASKVKEKDLKINYTIDDSVPSNIISDKNRLRQVLLNLINNAIKFTYIGEININVGSVAGDQNSFQFSVSDTGIGVPKDKIGRLFKSFSQVDASTTRKFGGTGLGLAISKKIVELLGGNISIESKEGHGSNFTFTIKAIPTKSAISVSKLNPELKASLPLPKIRILMAEDNLINQKVIIKLLEGSGLSVDIAHNGIEAIRMVKEKQYDLVLMDVQMPEMDGLEATKVIQEDLSLSKKPVIIALTANAFKEDRELCLNAGMDDYLSKPVQKKDMESMINKWFKEESVRSSN